MQPLSLLPRGPEARIATTWAATARKAAGISRAQSHSQALVRAVVLLPARKKTPLFPRREDTLCHLLLAPRVPELLLTHGLFHSPPHRATGHEAMVAPGTQMWLVHERLQVGPRGGGLGLGLAQIAPAPQGRTAQNQKMEMLGSRGELCKLSTWFLCSKIPRCWLTNQKALLGQSLFPVWFRWSFL